MPFSATLGCLLTLVRDILIVASARILSRIIDHAYFPACFQEIPVPPVTHGFRQQQFSLQCIARFVVPPSSPAQLQLAGYSRSSPALTLARISGSAGTHFGGPTPAGREAGIRLRGSAGPSAPEAGAGPGCKRASRSWAVPGSSGGVVTVRHRCHPGTSRALRTLRNVASAAMPLRLAPRPPFRLHPESTSPSRH